MKRFFILTSLLIIVSSLTSCSNKNVVSAKEVSEAITNQGSWKVMADWNFGANTKYPTRFQGKAYYVGKGKDYLWVDHGMGSTIPIRVKNGLLDAPMESSVIKAMPVGNPAAQERINHDLFMQDPLKLAILTNGVFTINNKGKYTYHYVCVGSVKKIYNCLKWDFVLTLGKDKNPETLILTSWFSKEVNNITSFYYSDYGKVTLQMGEEGVNFDKLAPPDYAAMGASLDKVALQKEVKDLKSQSKK